MTTRFWILICLLSVGGWARADYSRGNQSLSIGLGPAGYSKPMDVNNGESRLEDCGGVVFLQYLYFLKGEPSIGLGLELAGSGFEEDGDSSLVPGGKSEAKSQAAMTQLVAKLSYPKGRWRPYVIGGIGSARTTLNADIQTASGEQATFDSGKYGFASNAGVGLDIFLGKRFFFGPELRYYLLSRRLHEPTDYGRSIGVKAVRDPGSISTVMLRIGWIFGGAK